MSLQYFVSNKPGPEPVSEALRRVAFPADHRLPQSLASLIRKLCVR
ncbi:MAG TPA: hypothetical protein VD768_02995 [Sphingomicrobium sp.]|nr:hypothetical protein [Sphingomicrobium sp.]